MTEVIVFTNNEDRVCLMHPSSNVYVPEDFSVSGGPFETFEIEQDGWRLATIDEIAARDVPQMGGNTWNIVNREDILADTYFFGAWKNEDGVISIDMIKAVDIQKSILRELRAPELAALDIKYYRALETGDSQEISNVVSRKNALRDVTKDPGLLSATTPEELKLAGINIINGV